MRLQIYTDGGARGNPGPAGIGVVVWEGNDLIGRYKKFIGEATNNQAEYEAVLFALQKVKGLEPDKVDIYMDSELAVNQLSRRYKIKNQELGSLFVKIWNLMIEFKKVEFHYIPREENKEADKLVNQAIDEEL